MPVKLYVIDYFRLEAKPFIHLSRKLWCCDGKNYVVSCEFYQFAKCAERWVTYGQTNSLPCFWLWRCRHDSNIYQKNFLKKLKDTEDCERQFCLSCTFCKRIKSKHLCGGKISKYQVWCVVNSCLCVITQIKSNKLLYCKKHQKTSLL